MTNHRAEFGFTLIEMAVATVLTAFVVAGLYSFFRGQIFAFRTMGTDLDVKQSAEAGLDFMLTEIRMTGSRPDQAQDAGCGLAIPSIAVTPTCESFEAITAADGDSISIQYDYRGDVDGDPPDNCADDVNEQITYALNTGAGTIDRTTSGGTAVVIRNVAATGLRFRYYTSAGTELQSGGGALTATERHDVGRIVVAVTTSAANPDPRATGNVTTTQTSTVDLRSPPC